MGKGTIAASDKCTRAASSGTAPLRRLSRLSHAALAAAFAGLFFAAVLSVSHLLDLPVPCGKSRGCMAVAMHPSANLFGIPIAFFGTGAYMALLFLLTRDAAVRWARPAASFVAGLGAAISIGLLIYSQSVIRATCWWCVGSCAAMVSLFALSLVLLKSSSLPCRPRLVWSLAAVTAAAIGVQAGMMQRAALRPPIPASRLADMTVEQLVDAGKCLGPAHSPVTIVVYADMWCPACRQACDVLMDYQRKNPSGVRLAYRHLPLWELRGHESSRAAAALSEMAAEDGKFWTFIETLHGRHTQMDRAAYLAIMEHLGFEPDAVERRLSDPEDPAIARVLHDEDLAAGLGINATPTFVVLAAGQKPVSANQKTLPRILNSATIQSILLRSTNASE